MPRFNDLLERIGRTRYITTLDLCNTVTLHWTTQVLQGCEDWAAAYLDDVVIYSSFWAEHLKHIQQTLKKIDTAVLTLNIAKCEWAKQEINYLGYHLGNGQIPAQSSKVQTSQNGSWSRWMPLQWVWSSPGPRRPWGREAGHLQYLSRKLLPRETRYSTTEKEGLAIKWSLDSLRYYLLGREFDLEMDHQALSWIHSMRDQKC